MKWTIGTKISGLVVFIIAIFIILGITSLLMTNRLKTSISWNMHTYQVLQNQKQILLLLKGAEMDNRGYIITEDEKYLEMYNQVEKSVMKKIDDGLELTKDNPKQQQRIANLKLLVVDRLTRLGTGIDLRREKGFEAAEEFIFSGLGEKIMDDVQSVITEIEKDENILLNSRALTMNNSIRMAKSVIIYGSSFSIILIIIIGFLIVRNISGPLNEITKIATRIGEGDLDVELPVVERKDEVGIFLQSFNSMIGALKKSRNKLLQLNFDKDRLIYILGHDLKNPFNNICAFSEILTDEINSLDKDEIKDIAKNINKSAKVINKLLEDILMWARAQQSGIPFRPQNLSLSVTCGNILKILNPSAYAKNITIYNSSADHINVFADADMLKTTLLNLVSNAIKFTNSGGKIAINAEKNSENVIISVSDNGIGISPDSLAKLFNISEVLTTKGTAGETGTGFGLFLCKEFVEKHQGKIWVESEEGKGSDFKFTIPIFTEHGNDINN